MLGFDGYNEDLEIQRYKDMCHLPTENHTNYDEYEDWERHICDLYDELLDDKRTEQASYKTIKFYFINRLNSTEQHQKMVEVILIPLYLGLFSLFAAALNLDSIQGEILILILMAGTIFPCMKFLFDATSKVTYYKAVVDIITSEDFKQHKGIH